MQSKVLRFRSHWLLGFLFACSSMLFLNLLLSIWPAYKTLSGIDVGLAGLILGVSCLVGDTLQILFGPLGVRYGPKRFLLIALLFACPIALIYGGWTSHGIGIGFGLLYIAVGAAYPNSALCGFLLKPKTPGRMVSLIMSASYLGYALGPFVMRLLFDIRSRFSFGLFVPLALLLFLGLLYRFPDKLQGNRKVKVGLSGLRPHWRPLALLWLCQFALQGITLSVLLLIPELLQSRHLPLFLCLGGGHFAFIMGTALSSFFGRSLADRPHPFVIIGGASATGLAGFVVLLFFPLAPIALLALLALIGGSIGLLVPLNIALGNRIVPGKEGAVSGLLMGGAWGMGGVVPLVAGRIVVSGGADPLLAAFLWVSSLLLIPLASALILPYIAAIPAAALTPRKRLRTQIPFPMIPIEWEEELDLAPEVFSLDTVVWAPEETDGPPELADLVPRRSVHRFEGATAKRRTKVRTLLKPVLRQFPKRKT